MWKILPLALVQSILLAGGQVFLKVALARMDAFSWTWRFWSRLLVNWPFALCGLCFLGASLLWMYLIKTFPLSIAYPMVSLSYVFGMIAAIVFFHESVSPVQWLGVLLIMVGCSLVAVR